MPYSPFSLERKMARISNFNPFKEIHGDEKKLAGALTIELSEDNGILAEFDPELKSAFFRAPDQDGDQLDIDPNYMPIPRFAKMGTVKWDYEQIGSEVIVHHGINQKSEVKLIECHVKKFSFTFNDGGRVLVGFTVICHPDAKQVGILSDLIQESVEISLFPPEGDDDADDD